MAYSENAKRAFDLAASAALLTVLTPACGVIAGLIKMEDGGPVLYRQPRAGVYGSSFQVYKFRSMKVGATGAPIDTSSWADGVPDDFVFKAPSASANRVTRCGGWLRRTSLDEVPQLLNVFRGEMSLVGPRPEIFPISDKYSPDQARRLSVKPGITGLAQIRGRANSNHGEKIQADLEYVDSWSFLGDLRILAQTIIVAVTGKGAH